MKNPSKQHGRKQDGETTYWLSYSDMMAGLLLCFVLIIALTSLHARMQYDEKQNQLTGKEKELSIQAAVLSSQEDELNAQASMLESQQDELNAQSTRIKEQEDTLNRQTALLNELQEVMDAQQEKLDRIIGIRSELIEALKKEFSNSKLDIAVDEKTGAITVSSNILFGYNDDVLKESGKQFMAEFLPRYANILLSDRYREYVSEIDIEGHTDTMGTYLFNLNLSQKRAYSVAEYCLSDESPLLSKDQLSAMRELISTNGKSYTDPVLNANGSVNMEASRRVEFLFKLKDEDMIWEMIEILNESENTES